MSAATFAPRAAEDPDDPAGAVARLCDWAARTRPDATTLDRAQAAITDTLACMVAGTADPAPALLAQAMQAASGLGGPATALGLPQGASPAIAALLNGTAAHALDFDDSGIGVLGHASAVMTATALAVAAVHPLSGAGLATGFAVGIELQERLGRMANPGHYALGWHATGTLCALGAAAGAARMLGLDAAGIAAALGIASSLIGGSKVQFGTPMKPIHAGLAARAAVEAALMARAGLAGDPGALSGRWGFFDLYAQIPNAATVRRAMAGLGQRSALDEGALLAKRFPSCAATHKTLDGLLELRAQIDPEQAVSVETWVPATLAANLRFDRPVSEMQARFSMPYCCARLLDRGALRLADFAPATVAQAATEASLSRITMHDTGPHPDPIAAPVLTRITLADGRRVETAVSDAVGGPARPLDAAALAAKFEDCWQHAGGAGDPGTALAAARRVATADDAGTAIAAFAAHLHASGRYGGRLAAQ